MVMFPGRSSNRVGPTFNFKQSFTRMPHRRLCGATMLSLQHAANALASIPWDATTLPAFNCARHVFSVARIVETLARYPDLVEAAGGLAWAVSVCSQCLVWQDQGGLCKARVCLQLCRACYVVLQGLPLTGLCIPCRL